jgi:hypothetical protein
MFMLQKMHALAAGGEAAYVANAVDFDGSNDFLTRGAGLTGASDAATGILSCWIRFDGGDGSTSGILNNAVSRCNLRKRGDNLIVIDVASSAGTTLSFGTVNAYTANAAWRHVLMSWDTNFSAGAKVSHLYVSDASDKAVLADAGAAFNVDYTDTNWIVGALNTGGSNKLNGCVAELYFAPGQFLDFSNSANRRKFISATGKPVSLGADGSLPTGTAPLVYLNNPAASFGTNKGTGGDFTITGTLDTASTSPSD